MEVVVAGISTGDVVTEGGVAEADAVVASAGAGGEDFNDNDATGGDGDDRASEDGGGRYARSIGGGGEAVVASRVLMAEGKGGNLQNTNTSTHSVSDTWIHIRYGYMLHTYPWNI
jgi:hypothetical protein